MAIRRRRRLRRAEIVEAFAALRELRSRGHQPGCPCQSRYQRGCLELRGCCLAFGLWREVAELCGEY